ncbi:MAG: phosphoribosyltransferase family protein, partial [Chryseobacterium sp.]
GLDSSNFDYLTSKIKKEQMDHLLELAISNNYHLIKEYENNINTLTQTELNYGY